MSSVSCAEHSFNVRDAGFPTQRGHHGPHRIQELTQERSPVCLARRLRGGPSSALSRIVGARCLAVVQDVGSAPIPLRLAA